MDKTNKCYIRDYKAWTLSEKFLNHLTYVKCQLVLRAALVVVPARVESTGYYFFRVPRGLCKPKVNKNNQSNYGWIKRYDFTELHAKPNRR